MKRAFTLLEVLVVIAIISLLMAVLMPVLSRVREQANVLAVNVELNQIGLALEMYMMDNEKKHPPTREDCVLGDHHHQLPKELVRGGYLPGPPMGTWMSSGMEDRFNRGRTYKYWGVGEVIRDRDIVDKWLRAELWIPDGFPEGENNQGRKYPDPKNSPVTWVVFSLGPRFDWERMKNLCYPVPKRTWYDPQKRTGVITRMRLKKGWHVGTFEK